MSEVAVPTINEYYKKYRDLDVSYDTLYCKELSKLTNDDYIILLTDSITSNYKNDLKEIVTIKTFTPEEERKYFYNPQILSYDLYGTTQFWYMILELNEMSSAMEFNRSTIKLYDGSLPTMVNSILALEEKTINLNQDEISIKNISLYANDTY